MSLTRLVRSRFERGFLPSSLGPNEARILYDLAVSVGASVATALFLWGLSVGQPRLDLLAAPVLFLVFNAALGMYSRLKTARGMTKAMVLAASCGLTIASSLALGAQMASAALWFLLTTPSVALARLFLAIPNSRRHNVAVSVVRQRGPTLVLGGAGYIGSHVVDLLLKQGRTVRVLDNLMYGDASVAEFRSNPNFELATGDVTDIAELTAAMRGVSSVVHLAGLVGDPACAVDPDFTRHTNIVATRMAKDVATSMGVYRFVFASSCSVYGMSDKEVKEGDKLNPVSLYAQSKIDSEEELLRSVTDDFFVTVLRFATVFGHSRRPRFDLVANLFTAQAMVDGRITVIGPDQWRPFVHVRDLARAIVTVLNARPSEVQSQVFNVGDTRMNLTILQLAEVVKKVVEARGKRVEISVTDNPDDRRNYCVSFSKIKSFLGFEAETLMEAGVVDMVEHFTHGDYAHYRNETYSNVAMTKKALAAFNDPMQAMKLYAPLARKAS